MLPQYELTNTLHSPIECFFYDAHYDPFPVDAHWHYFMEIIYVTQGSARIIADGQTFLVSPGQLIILHPGVIHTIEIDSSSKKLLRYAVLKFDINRLPINPEYAPKLRRLFDNAREENCPILFPSSILNLQNPLQLFSDCIREMHEKPYGYDMVIQSHIYILLTSLLRVWQKDGWSVSEKLYQDDMDYHITTITEFIDAHLGEDLLVTDIAACCHMSYSLFARRFKELYGRSCKEYINFMRVCKVEDYLLFTDFDLTYISQETGFADCSHMIKTFRKYKRITPKQFRVISSK